MRAISRNTSPFLEVWIYSKPTDEQGAWKTGVKAWVNWAKSPRDQLLYLENTVFGWNGYRTYLIQRQRVVAFLLYVLENITASVIIAELPNCRISLTDGIRTARICHDTIINQLQIHWKCLSTSKYKTSTLKIFSSTENFILFNRVIRPWCLIRPRENMRVVGLRDVRPDWIIETN